MRHLHKSSTVILLYLLFLPLVTVFTLYLYFAFDQQLDVLNENIMNKELKRVEGFAANISKAIDVHGDMGIVEKLSSDTALRRSLEKEISLFISDQYAYIYLLHRDDAGKFRYLIDASLAVDERGEFNQKFDEHGDVWERVYRLKKPQHQTQKGIEDLWITYVYPVVHDGQIEAVLVFDYSNSDYMELTHSTKPMQRFFLFLSLFLFVMLVIGYVQFYMYYRSHRKGIIDPLTGAFNRQYLKEIGKRLKLKEYQLCLIDIDHFKSINDTYGHDGGDVVLKTMVKRVQNHIRKDDFLIRYGGEEFVLFLHNCNCDTDNTIVERLRNALKQEPIHFNDNAITITASFGLNRHPDKNSSLDEAISEADEYLYIAKQSGRDCIISSKEPAA